MIETNGVYRQGPLLFRVLHIARDPEHGDMAFVVEMQCTSTRIRRQPLSLLVAGLEQKAIIREAYPAPVIRPEITRSAAVQRAFRPIREKLEELWTRGIPALAARPLWPELRKLAARARVSPYTLNRAFTRMVQAGGVVDAALPRWHACGQKPATTKDRRSPTKPKRGYALKDADFAFSRAVR